MFIVSTTSTNFVVTVDEVTTLCKDKNDILCEVSAADSTVVQIWETSPNEGQKNIILSAKYDEFTTPSGASAAAVCTGINAILRTVNGIMIAVPDGDYGDITVSSSGSVWTVDTGLYQPLDADLTAIAALTTTTFGRAFLALADAAAARTAIGGTTVGQNVFTLADPSAVRYPRYNADNTVTALSAASLLTDLIPPVDFSGTISPTGYTGAVTVQAAVYWKISTSAYLAYVNFFGTSNAATCTITFPANASITLSGFGMIRVTDNSIVQLTPGQIVLTAASGTIAFGKTLAAAGGFTIANTKAISGFFLVY